MFNFFPNSIVIAVLYILAAFFYSRFEYWLKVGFDMVGNVRGRVLPNRYSRRNLILFSIMLMAAIILSVIDSVMMAIPE